MGIMTFADYLDSANEAGINESALSETASGTVAKAATVGILLKMSQLRQNVAQDRMSTSADRSIASMLLMLASLVTVGIGTMASDSDLVNQGRRSLS